MILPSILLKVEKGVSNSTRLRPFLRQASSTRGVRRTITTGVISSNSIRPSGEFAGSDCPSIVAIVVVAAAGRWVDGSELLHSASMMVLSQTHSLGRLGFWGNCSDLWAPSLCCEPIAKASRGGLWPVFPFGLWTVFRTIHFRSVGLGPTNFYIV